MNPEAQSEPAQADEPLPAEGQPSQEAEPERPDEEEGQPSNDDELPLPPPVEELPPPPKVSITVKRYDEHGGSRGCHACNLGGPLPASTSTQMSADLALPIWLQEDRGRRLLHLQCSLRHYVGSHSMLLLKSCLQLALLHGSLNQHR